MHAIHCLITLRRTIAVLVLFCFAAFGEATLAQNSYVDHVSVFYTDVNDNYTGTWVWGGTSSTAIHARSGKPINVTVYRGSGVSGTCTYKILDSGNGLQHTANSSASSYYFSNIIGSADSDVWVWVNDQGLTRFTVYWEDLICSLQVDESSLNFGSSSTSESFCVRNSGGGTMSYSITDDRSWISVDPTSGSSSGSWNCHDVYVDRAQLNPGTHTGTVTVSSNCGTATISVIVVEPDPFQVNNVSIGSFSPPTVDQGGTVSNSGSISGSGSGTVTYYWRGTAAGYPFDSGALTVAMTNGSASIPTYTGFPTTNPGLHRMHIEVTSPSSVSSAYADYHVNDPEVQSVSIGSFSPTSVLPGAPVSNSGSLSGIGSATVTYHWRGSTPGGSFDSGELTVAMTDGSATIPTFNGFPTSQLGLHRMHVEVTSPSLVSSEDADYFVEGPDLYISDLQPHETPYHVTYGEIFGSLVQVSNGGTVASAPTNVTLVFSETLTAGWQPLYTDSIAAIAPGNSQSVVHNIQVLNSLGEPGEVLYFRAIADTDANGNEVLGNELDELNNWSTNSLSPGYFTIIIDDPLYHDLQVEGPSITDTSPEPGTDLDLTYTVQNHGTETNACSPFTNEVWWSTDTTLDGSDLLLGSLNMAGLAGGDSNLQTVPVHIPDTATGGSTYYILIHADAANVVAEQGYSGTYEDNNIGTLAVPVDLSPVITVTLEGTYAGATQQSSFQPGDEFTVKLMVQNTGGPVDAIVSLNIFDETYTWPNTTTSLIYDSHDSGTSEDVALSLGAGETQVVSFTHILSGTAGTGSYRVLGGVRRQPWGEVLDTTGPDVATEDWTDLAHVVAFDVYTTSLLSGLLGAPTVLGEIVVEGTTYTIVEHDIATSGGVRLPYEGTTTLDDQTFVSDPELAAFLLRTFEFRERFGLTTDAHVANELIQLTDWQTDSNLRGNWFSSMVAAIPVGGGLIAAYTSKRSVDKALLGCFFNKVGYSLLPAAIHPPSAASNVLTSTVNFLIDNASVDVHTDETKFLSTYYCFHSPTLESKALLIWSGGDMEALGDLLSISRDGAKAIKRVEKTQAQYYAYRAATNGDRLLARTELVNALKVSAASLGMTLLDDYVLEISDMCTNGLAGAVVTDLHLDAVNTATTQMIDDLNALRDFIDTGQHPTLTREDISAREERFATYKGLLLWGLIDEMYRSQFLRVKAVRDEMPNGLAQIYGATYDQQQNLRYAVIACSGHKQQCSDRLDEYRARCVAADADVALALETLSQPPGFEDVLLTADSVNDYEIPVGTTRQLSYTLENTLPVPITQATAGFATSSTSGVLFSASLGTGPILPGETATILVEATVPVDWYYGRVTAGGNEGVAPNINIPLQFSGDVGGEIRHVEILVSVSCVPQGEILDVSASQEFVVNGSSVLVTVDVNHDTVPNPYVVAKVTSPVGLEGLGYAQAVNGSCQFQLDFMVDTFGPYGMQLALLDETQTYFLTPWHSVNKLIHVLPSVQGDLCLKRPTGLAVFTAGANADLAQRLVESLGTSDYDVYSTDGQTIDALTALAAGRQCVVIGVPGVEALLDHLIATEPLLDFSPTHEGEMLLQVLDGALGGQADFVVVSGYRDREAEIAVMALAREWLDCGWGEITVSVDPDISAGEWFLSGPNGWATQGQGDSLVSLVTPGSYTVTWLDGDCWIAPPPETATLLPDSTLQFQGTFQERGGPVVLTAPAPQQAMEGGCATFEIEVSGVGQVSYAWTSDGVPVGGDEPQLVLCQLSLQDDESVIVCTASDTCGSTTTEGVTLQVLSCPTAIPTNDGPVCEGDPVTLFGDPDDMESYSWTGPQGFTSSERNPIVDPAVAGDYWLTVSVGGCTSDAVCTTVVVNPNPEAPSFITCENEEGDGVSFYCFPTDFQYLILTACDGSGAPIDDADSEVEWSLDPPYGDIGTGNPLVYPVPGVSPDGSWEFKARVVNDCASSPYVSRFVGSSQTPPCDPLSNSPVCEGQLLELVGYPLCLDAYHWTGPDGYECSSLGCGGNCGRLADPSMSGWYTLITEFENCFSEPVSIYVEVVPLVQDPPTIVSPVDGQYCVPTDMAFEWLPVPEATSYDVHWGATNPPPFWQNVTTTTAMPPAAENSTYFWQVVPKNDCGEGPAGMIWSYHTVNDNSDIYFLAGSAPQDLFGISVASVDDIDGDSKTDFVIGAEHASHLGQPTGKVFVYSGADRSLIYALTGPESGCGFGECVAGAGDVDNDGVPDVIVGAPGASTNGTDSGNALVFSGADASLLYTFVGEAANTRLGSAVAGAGDLDGDGHADLIVGSNRDDTAASDAGRVQVFSGADGVTVLLDLFGSSQGDMFGTAVAGGTDVDGDMVPDILIGAIGDDSTVADAGSVTVISGLIGLPLLGSPFHGDLAGDELGLSVAFCGDVNGDGTEDFVSGSQLADGNGVDSGMIRVYSGFDGSVLHTIHGAEGAQLGHRVSGAGDVDGDGLADFAGGGGGDDTAGAEAGLVAVFSGSDGSPVKEYFGAVAGDNLFSVAHLGDINGNGSEDLVIGAYQAGNGGPGYARVVSTGCVPPSDEDPGTAYCPGDGSGTPCPCNNDNDGSLLVAGCANGVFASGAKLAGSGQASVTNDELRLLTRHTEPGNAGLYFQADNDLSPGLVWGDGLRCAGGSLRRLGVVFSNGSGYSDTAGFPLPISQKAGNVLPGSTKYYQCWYRTTQNPPCGLGVNDFNVSNGYAVTWRP